MPTVGALRNEYFCVRTSCCAISPVFELRTDSHQSWLVTAYTSLRSLERRMVWIGTELPRGRGPADTIKRRRTAYARLVDVAEAAPLIFGGEQGKRMFSKRPVMSSFSIQPAPFEQPQHTPECRRSGLLDFLRIRETERHLQGSRYQRAWRKQTSRQGVLCRG